MSNVLEFPKSAIVRDTASQTAERLTAAKERSTKNFADSLVVEMCEEMVMGMEACGIDTESEAFQKDFVFLSQVLSATIYRSMEIPHAMQKFIDETVTLRFVDPNEESPQGELELPEPEIETPLLPPPGSTS